MQRNKENLQANKSVKPKEDLKKKTHSKVASRDNSKGRVVSVPRLQLQSLDNSNKENYSSFNITNNKNTMQVPVFQGILSPINMKETNRELNTKLEQLYQSYDLKEKVFGDESFRQAKKQDEEEIERDTPLRKVNDFFKQLKLEWVLITNIQF